MKRFLLLMGGGAALLLLLKMIKVVFLSLWLLSWLLLSSMHEICLPFPPAASTAQRSCCSLRRCCCCGKGEVGREEMAAVRLEVASRRGTQVFGSIEMLLRHSRRVAAIFAWNSGIGVRGSSIEGRRDTGLVQTYSTRAHVRHAYIYIVVEDCRQQCELSCWPLWLEHVLALPPNSNKWGSLYVQHYTAKLY